MAGGENFMRLKAACVSLAACLMWTISAIPLNAALGPSFDLDYCSWNATHIVLVQTTANDSVVSVLESWKGDLKPGDSIEVPELKPNENAVPISSYPKRAGFDFEDKSGISEQIPKQPIGSRMILFLNKQGGSVVGTPVKWGLATRAGIEFSVLWIDGEKAFCFQRRGMTIGPSTLWPCMRWPTISSDVAVFTARIEEVLRKQRDLARTLVLDNLDVRAERLGSIAHGDIPPAQKEAIDALGKSGVVALPEILQIMDKPPVRPYDGEALIRVFVEAAGRDSGRQLHARLQQDVIYWRTVGPTLSQDWLGQLIDVGSPLFVKFNETSLLIRELDREHYAPAGQTVAKLHDFWISQPHLYDPEWGDKPGEVRTSVSARDDIHSQAFGLAEECDAFLKKVERKD
jgi:hypothetical protein